MARRIDRRRFLGRLGAAAAASALGAPRALARTAPRRVAPGDRIGLGLIGVGSLGANHHLPKFLGMPEFEVLAVADPDREHVARAVQRTDGKAAGYGDYRRLLDRADIDAVLIATPDHWHALTAIHSCEAGKDVYCEKPLTLTIAEGRAIVRAARRCERVFQVGTQQRSDRRFRRACELVRNGRIGELRHVEAVLGRGPHSPGGPDGDAPATLDWDMWLGPAPWRPYNRHRCHYDFRWFYDYSGGKMTDWGAHHLDIAQWGIGSELGGPVEIEGTASHPPDNFFETAVDFDVHYRYANGVTLHATGKGENGVRFRGTAGEIFVSRSTIRANPPEILEVEDGAGPLRLRVSRDHHRDWLACLRTRERPISDVELGHRSATVCHLGNLAIHLGRKLRWDPAAERFVGDPAADMLLEKPMRHPWSL
jgi:predicted dehydrogenase